MAPPPPPENKVAAGGGAKKSAFGWYCRQCTFFHQVPGTRCSMCQALRSGTPQECHDFILGKKIPPVLEGNVVEIPSSPESPPDDKAKANNDDDDDDQKKPPASTMKNFVAESVKNEPAMAPAVAEENQPNRTAPMPFTHPLGHSAAAPLPEQQQQQRVHPDLSSMDPSHHASSSSSNNNSNNVVVPTLFQQNIFPNAAFVSKSVSINQNHHNSSAQNIRLDNRPSTGGTGGGASYLSVSTDLQQQQHHQQQQQQQQQQLEPTKQPLQQQQYQRPNQLATVFGHSAKTGLEEAKNQRRLSEVRFTREPFHEGPVALNREATKTWVYPQHDKYPIRDYQLEITETAVQYNTLVSLPTGLGKTHIAAVVMYNFYRWFAPTGKVVFMAPTVPLVGQQVEACFNVMGIPECDTCVMTGKTMKPTERREVWEQRRVFYCTPQTVQKDLEACIKQAEESGESSRSSFASQIVCVVLDEAHKATGNYAYVKVIELLESVGAKFRVVGLSATPGTSIKGVQAIIDALRTTRVQARTEEDESVKKYLHDKQQEVIVCEQNNWQGKVERHLTNMICPILNKLRNEGILRPTGNATVTPWLIFQEKQKYAEMVKLKRTNGYAFPLFAAAHKLATVRSSVGQSSTIVKDKLQRIKDDKPSGELKKIVDSPDYQILMELVDQAAGIDGADPKLVKLKEELFFHFEKKKALGESSKAIVFANSRDAVKVIVDFLGQFKPLIFPRHFIGQGSGSKGSSKSKDKDGNKSTIDDRLDGMPQKIQEKVIKQFREGVYNVLVCTSIGEEGLDIGEVDLIVTFDVVQSPTRYIQRAGRTGRKRNGRVICLVAAGHEEEKHRMGKQKEKTVQRSLKDDRKFTMANHRPMLESVPTRVFRTITMLSQMHMSQVVGALRTPATGKKRKRNDGNSKAWCLSAYEEEERQQRFGAIVALDKELPFRTLRRAFLRCRVDRSRSTMKRGKYQPEKIPLRRNLQILKHLRKFGPVHSRHGSSRISDVHRVFPLKPTEWEKCESDPVDSSTFGGLKQLWSAKTDSTINGVVLAESLDANADSASRPLRMEQGNALLSTSGQTPVNSNLASYSISQSKVPSMNPTTSSLGNEGETMFPNPHANAANLDPASTAGGKFWNTDCNDNKNKDATIATSCEMQRINLAQDPPSPAAAPASTEAGFVFRLKTPPPSSDSSCDEDESDEEVDQVADPPIPLAQDALRRNEPETSNCPDGNMGREMDSVLSKDDFGGRDAEVAQQPQNQMCDEVDTGFRLPTQDSSSSEDEDEEEGDVAAADGNDESSQQHDGSSSTKPNASTGEDDCSDIEDDIPLVSLKSDPCALSSQNREAVPAMNDQDHGPIETTVETRRSEGPDKQQAENDRIAKREMELGGLQQEESVKAPSLSESESQEIVDVAVRCAKRRRIRSIENEEQEEEKEGSNGTTTVALGGSLSATQLEQAPLPTSKTPSKQGLKPDLSWLEDTPETNSDNKAGIFPLTLPAKADISDSKNECTHDALVDTPCTESRVNVFCQICMADDYTDEDPLILCDSCGLGFHTNCYSMDIDWTTNDTWYCESCNHRSAGSPDSCCELKCAYCANTDGVLRDIADIGWSHPLCHLFHSEAGNQQCGMCCRRRTIRCSECTEATHPFCSLDAGWTIINVQSTPNDLGLAKSTIFCPKHAVSYTVTCKGVRIIIGSKKAEKAKGLSTFDEQPQMPGPQPKRLIKKSAVPVKRPPKASNEKPETSIHASSKTETAAKETRREQFRKRRGRVANAFFLEEADVDSDQDLEGDEDEESACRRMESEDALSQDSFINDNENLTQHASQDDLDAVDPDAAGATFDYHHRALDAQRERDNLFKTPLLNRRQMQSDQECASVPSSERQLGRMPFIRSLYAHVRDGGDADDVEATYQQLAANGTQWSPSASQSAGSPSQETPALDRQMDAKPVAAAQAVAKGPLFQQTNHSNGGQKPPLPAPAPRKASALTAEQLARIEANRLAALKRKAAFQQQMQQQQDHHQTSRNSRGWGNSKHL